jgi:hypothetical protein
VQLKQRPLHCLHRYRPGECPVAVASAGMAPLSLSINQIASQQATASPRVLSSHHAGARNSGLGAQSSLHFVQDTLASSYRVNGARQGRVYSPNPLLGVGSAKDCGHPTWPDVGGACG